MLFYLKRQHEIKIGSHSHRPPEREIFASLRLLGTVCRGLGALLTHGRERNRHREDRTAFTIPWAGVESATRARGRMSFEKGASQAWGRGVDNESVLLQFGDLNPPISRRRFIASPVPELFHMKIGDEIEIEKTKRHQTVAMHDLMWTSA